MMLAIKNWLNGSRDYDAGVLLYHQYGDDRQMKALFKEFRTPFKEKKLLELLKALMGKIAEVKVVAKKVQQSIQQETETRHGWPLQLDATLKALYDGWKLKFDETRSLEARLYDVAKKGGDDKNSEMEAGAMAHRILDLRDEIREMYKDRDYYLQHGHFPGKAQSFKPVVNDLKIAERRLTVRRYLTRLKKELEKPEKPHIRLKQEDKWKQYTDEMQYINKKLNRPDNEGIPARNK